MKTINIKFNKDYRSVFKAGQEIHIPIQMMGITYLVGQNGCGKSTILRAIRNTNDSMHKKLKHDFDGCRNKKLSSVMDAQRDGIIEITGLEKYTHMYDKNLDSPWHTRHASMCLHITHISTNYRGYQGSRKEPWPTPTKTGIIPQSKYWHHTGDWHCKLRRNEYVIFPDGEEFYRNR